ncbi:MAG: metalloregulator ArsR/SmtB family transcription factor [Acidimicrobiia bacterium]|nr:metalloregulator ArsR/SmtB family transcription factor [Acidimicrobiia bacterium]
MSGSPLQTRLSLVAEGTRFRIVERLREGECSVGDLVDHLDLDQPQVSRHLKILHDANLVAVRREGQRRIYSLKPNPFRELSEWFDTFGRVWEERMDALDEYLQDTNDEQGGDK